MFVCDLSGFGFESSCSYLKKEDFRILKESKLLYFHITGRHVEQMSSIMILMETFKTNQFSKLLSFSLTDKEYRLVLIVGYLMSGWKRNNILPDRI